MSETFKLLLIYGRSDRLFAGENGYFPLATLRSEEEEVCRLVSSSETRDESHANSTSGIDHTDFLAPSFLQGSADVWGDDLDWNAGQVDYNIHPFDFLTASDNAGVGTKTKETSMEYQGLLETSSDTTSMNPQVQYYASRSPELILPEATLSNLTVPEPTPPSKETSLMRDTISPAGLPVASLSLPQLDSIPENLQQGTKRSLSTTSSIISGAFRSRKKVLSLNRKSNDPTDVSRPTSEISNTDDRVSFKSFMSISSSQKNDIISILRNFSLSSRGTICSSTCTLNFEEDRSSHELSEEGRIPQVVALEDLYVSEPPNYLPSHILISKINMLKVCTTTCQQSDCSCEACITSMESIFEGSIGRVMKGMWKNSLVNIGADRRDRLDQTPLHIVAAAGAQYAVLMAALERELDVNAVNTAGQTFLHVLDPSALVLSGSLPSFLGNLKSLDFDFSKRDHNGRNVLQALLQHKMHHEVMNGVFEVLHSRLDLMAGRDNLGCSIQSRLVFLARCTSVDNPGRAQKISQILSKYYELDPASYGSSAFDFAPSVHSRLDICALEDQICQALTNPNSEDNYGRNGLHFFA